MKASIDLLSPLKILVALVVSMICFVISLFDLTLIFFNKLKAHSTVIAMDHVCMSESVTVPDAARRYFKGRACACVFFTANPNVNLKLSLVWPDIDLIFLKPRMHVWFCKKKVVLPVAGFYISWIKKTHFAYLKLLQKVFRRDMLVIQCDPGSENDEFGKLMPDVTKRSSDYRKPRFFPDHVPPGYYQVLERTHAEHIGLPDPIRSQFRAVLGSSKKCHLYLRCKNQKIDHRTGSPIEDYLPSIRLLNELGYQVLLTGDRLMPASVYSEFKGKFLDWQYVTPNDPELFYLYAATDSDIAIVEAGGGCWLPTINQIPILMVNAFPYYHGLPNSWIHFKILMDRGGRMVDYRTLFSDYSLLYSHPLSDTSLTNYHLRNNNAAELLEAIKIFLDDVDHGVAEERNPNIAGLIPKQTWFKQSHARLSPAWVNLLMASQC